MKQAMRIVVPVVLLLALAACVAGSGESAHAADGGMLSQFLLGFWHGLIGPFTLIVEIIDRFAPHLLPWKTHLYETKAAGVAYDLGFYIGLAGSPVIVWSRRR
jgi:hypothetical protein